MVTPDLQSQAKEWLDRVDAGRGLSGNWRIEVIQKRYRKARDGSETECTDLPLRIRRFLPGCPWAIVAQVIRELVARAPYTNIICNGVIFSGTYRPTLTYWTRDESKSVDESKGANGTYTLVQDLVEDSECADALSVGSSSTCQYEEATEYHWDEASVDFTLPDCGPDSCGGTPGCQGVTHALAAVSRQEDGSFNYQVVKRTAKTVHTPEVEVRKASCGVGKITKESWDNVYGEPGDFRYDCGTPIVLPVTTVGQQVQFSIQMNNDCTYHIEAQIEYAPDPESYSWTDGDPCTTRTVEVRAGDKTMPTIPTLESGKTISANIERRPDCTYSSRIETTTKASGTSYTWTDNTKCRPRYNTAYSDYRSKPSTPSIGSGQRLEASISRNRDCTWDARFALLARAPSTSRSWTVGSYGHPQTVNYYKDSTSFPGVPSVSRGTEVTANFSYSDDCTWSGETRKSTARADFVSWSYGTSCTPVSAGSFRNQMSVPASATGVPEVGKELSSSIEVGDDGLYSGRYALTSNQAWSTSFTEGSLLHTDTTTIFKGQTSIPASVTPTVGTTVSYRVDRASDCTYSGSMTTRRATPATVSWNDGSACRSGSGTIGRNVTAVPSTVPARGETSISASINDDGTYDYTSRYRGPAVASNGTFSEGSAILHTQTQVYTGAAAPLSGGSGGIGTTVSASASFSKEDCTWSGQVSTTTRSPATRSWTEGTSCALTNRTVQYGVTSIPVVLADSNEHKVFHRSVSMNSDGTYDVSDSTTTLTPQSETVSWESTENGPNSSLTYKHKVTIFSNQKMDYVRNLLNGSSGSVSVSLSQVTGCLFSGQVATSQLTSWDISRGGGSSGGSSAGVFKCDLFKVLPDGRIWKNTIRIPVRTYYGSGNEGSRASAASNSYVVEGVSLPAGTYSTGGAPTYEGWKEVT